MNGRPLAPRLYFRRSRLAGFKRSRSFYCDKQKMISMADRGKGPMCSRYSQQFSGNLGIKKRPTSPFGEVGRIPGDDLLSQDLSSHYHRRCGVSLPGSEWDRVVPPRSGHQRATLDDQGWDSGDRSYVVVSSGSFKPAR